MTASLTIAPVLKTIHVGASPSHAFEVFTAGLSKWWPRNHGIGETPMKMSVLEPKLGGRWYELAENGSQAEVGRVLVWEPPKRFVVSWNINSQWKPDARIGSEVEVRFIPEGDGTRVELEHSKFEVMGEQGGTKMRHDVDNGWPKLLEIFAKAASA